MMTAALNTIHNAMYLAGQQRTHTQQNTDRLARLANKCHAQLAQAAQAHSTVGWQMMPCFAGAQAAVLDSHCLCVLRAVFVQFPTECSFGRTWTSLLL